MPRLQEEDAPWLFPNVLRLRKHADLVASMPQLRGLCTHPLDRRDSDRGVEFDPGSRIGERDIQDTASVRRCPDGIAAISSVAFCVICS